MKKLILLLSIFFIFLDANELSWVDKQIAAIKPIRKGLTAAEMDTLKDPFIFLKENSYKRKARSKLKYKRASKHIISKSKSFKRMKKRISKNKIQYVRLNVIISAIMNQSVLIKSKWYKIGDTLKGFKIIKIDINSVILAKRNKRAILSMKSKRKKLNLGIN